MRTFRIDEAYAKRPIRFLELWQPDGWRIKVYGIAYRRSRPGTELIAAAKALAEPCLPRPAVTARRYGVGFMGVHEGRASNLVFVDWWADENEVHHRVFTDSPDRPLDFTDVTATGPTACVWDLAVIGFERRAWIDAVLAHPEAPDLERYLAARMSRRV